MTAIHDAVSPLTALGIQSSYQNEGDAFEADWQEGTITTLCRFPSRMRINNVLTPTFQLPSLLRVQVCGAVVHQAEIRSQKL